MVYQLNFTETDMKGWEDEKEVDADDNKPQFESDFEAFRRRSSAVSSRVRELRNVRVSSGKFASRGQRATRGRQDAEKPKPHPTNT